MPEDTIDQHGPFVINVEDQSIPYYVKRKNFPLDQVKKDAAAILTLATEPEQPPSGVHLGELFASSGIQIEQIKGLKSYLSSGASRLVTNPNEYEIVQHAVELLSGAIGQMNIKTLKPCDKETEDILYDTLSPHSKGTLRLPDKSGKQSE